ncbi:MAG: hypothetical protein A2857_04300 [Candidatus Levybacteria bacterium RIFCSPHIGHO2_01_FULL_36_15]|nr:MAG: hypothetical protein A2857_04300 [Candidatus Levybacteria bacterium RIFCSPHIGHO2_01_FULL_36_15]OGH37309.1 MAG: hypothetical protein A2905_03575 [Candidatus Levybacteria bacterium RIFCSPLOWO2_01_FULL_36_10]
MSKPESQPAHRTDVLDLASWQLTTTYSKDYEGLDPYGEVPHEALRVTDDILEIDKELKEKIKPCGRSVSSDPKMECFSIGVMLGVADFEKRYKATELRVDFNQPEEEGVNFRITQNTYYLYENGVGVFIEIDHKDMGPREERRVLKQHFVTTADLPTIRYLKDYLLKRD